MKTTTRADLITEALEIAINSLEFDGEHEKAEKVKQISETLLGSLCPTCYIKQVWGE